MQINIPSESILMRVEKRIKAIQELYSYVKKMTPHDPDMEGYVTEDWLGDNKYITGGSNQTLTDPQKQQARENIGAEESTDIVVIDSSVSTMSAEVGKYYRFDVPVGTLAITLPTMTDTTTAKTIVFYLTAGSSPAVTFTSTHSIIYPKDYTIEANRLYEIGAAWNGIGWVLGLLTLEIPT